MKNYYVLFFQLFWHNFYNKKKNPNFFSDKFRISLNKVTVANLLEAVHVNEKMQIVNVADEYQGGAECFLRERILDLVSLNAAASIDHHLTKDTLMAAIDCESVSLSSMLEPQWETGKSWEVWKPGSSSHSPTGG